MNVTVTIPNEVIDAFKIEFKDQFGRAPTKQEMQEFFQKDIPLVYEPTFQEYLGDAVEQFFQDA